MDSRWGTVTQAAKIIGCTNRWVQMLMKGKEPQIKGDLFWGKQFKVWLPDAERYKKNRRPRGPKPNGKRST